MRTTRLACAIAALLFVASACSSTSEQVSDKIATRLESALSLTGKPVTTCPKDAKAEKGQKFTCETTVEGQSIKMDVTFTKDNFFTFKPEGNVVKAAELADDITSKLGAASTDCGPKAHPVITAAQPYYCTAKAKDGSSHKITVSWNGRNLEYKAA